MTDEHFMKMAIVEAQKAFDNDEVPIGAVIVMDNRIIARGHNQVELLHDCTAHAEMIALTSAFNELGSKYLPQASLYVTVEPCLMCCGALYWSKIQRVVFGTPDIKNGYLKHFPNENISPFHPKTQVSSGILAEESISLMQQFFNSKRQF